MGIEDLLIVKVDESEILTKEKWVYSRKQFDAALRMYFAAQTFAAIYPSWDACGGLTTIVMWFAGIFSFVGVVVAFFPLVCCGGPKFDFLDIFTDCISETYTACVECLQKCAAAAPKAEVKPCCEVKECCKMPACCDKLIIACAPCFKVFEPTKKCFGRLVGVAYALPLWMIMAIPFLLVGLMMYQFAVPPVPGLSSATCGGGVSWTPAIVSSSMHAALTGIRLHHGSDGFNKINFYAELV